MMMEGAWVYAGGAAMLTLIASGWSYVRSFWAQLTSRLVVTMQVSGYQSEAIQLMLRDQFVPSRLGPREYIGWLLHVPSRQRTQLVAMETIGTSGRIFWKGWRPVWVVKDGSDGEVEEGVTARDWNSNGVKLLFIRGTFETDAVVFAAAEHFNRRMASFQDSEIPGQRRHFVRHVFGTAGHTQAHLQMQRNNSTPFCPVTRENRRR